MLRNDLVPRIFFDSQVLIEVGEGQPAVVGRAHNLCRGGVFVCCDQEFELDTSVQIRFALPDGAMVECEGRVVRVAGEDQLEPTGVALAFGTMAEATRARIEGFISGRLQPAEGEAVRLSIGDIDVPIKAHTQAQWDDYIAVDAELPFLRLGTDVQVAARAGALEGSGAIRWVSVHISPDKGVPRLNIGIELARAEAKRCDEELDPICSADFAAHAAATDQRVRAERKAAAS